MAKKKSKKIVEPKPVEEVEELEEDDSFIDDDDEDDGLTYTKRFTVSFFQPEKSYGGSRCYKDFCETNTLAEAKKEAQKLIDEKKVEIMICDRDKWCLEPLLLQPPEEEKSDDTTTTESKTSSKRGKKKGTSTSAKPKPKHTRRKR